MSWLATLYETYGNIECKGDGEGHLLWPISHFVKNAHIELIIDGSGNFLQGRAKVLHGEDCPTLIPASESSAGRSGSKIAPHPLCEEIGYCAADYPKVNQEKVDAYIEQLRSWVTSRWSHPKAKAVLTYIERGTMWEDISREIEFPIKIQKAKGGSENVSPEKAFIRWRIEEPGQLDTTTWTDTSLISSWIGFDSENNSQEGFCCVQGELGRRASNHPRFIRRPGDGAKLISSNDQSGFTFRGRFNDTKSSIEQNGVQAVGVSFDVTQKSHNALRWLISRQGFRNDDQVFVSWAVSGKETPEPLQSSYNLFSSELIFEAESPTNEESGIDHSVDIGESFSNKLKKYLAGYSAKLDPNEQIVIMGLDSATPGRMGIIYYRQLLASEFLERIESWHRQFAWFQRHTIEVPDPKGKKKPKSKTVWPISSPAPRVIADAAYGAVLKSNDTLKKSVIERIMPCIVDGRPFPRDILESAVRRASNRNNCEHWEWERNMGVTCALYRGFFQRHPKTQERREYKMALEEDIKTKDYLYGRLLAIAEYIEETALRVAGENRPTSAARLMQRFADRPFSTWRTIELGLQPYMQRLQANRTGFLVNRKKELDAVQAAFAPEDFADDKALTGEFLLGYHCQKQAWAKSSNDNQETEIEIEGE